MNCLAYVPSHRSHVPWSGSQAHDECQQCTLWMEIHEVSPQFLLEMPSKPKSGQCILAVVQGAPLLLEPLLLEKL